MGFGWNIPPTFFRKNNNLAQMFIFWICEKTQPFFILISCE